VPALEALVAQRVPIAAVLTLSPPLAAKRSAAADYISLCRRFNLPLYQVADINDDDTVALLQSLSLDLVFVLGWSQILRPATLRTARLGMIGAHASLLPHNRGSAPINWALIGGEVEGGNTLMWLAEGLDTGEIIDQTKFPISPYDTCATLYDRVAASNREMILRVLPQLLAGERPGRPQPITGQPVLPRRRPGDGKIDWTLNSGALYNFVRALTRPYPGAFSWLDGRRWLIWQAALVPAAPQPAARPGEVLGPVWSPVEAACGQLVACGRGSLVLLEVEGDDGEVLKGRHLADQDWTGKMWADA
jgi:methionyl-tRNA formyltransferase